MEYLTVVLPLLQHAPALLDTNYHPKVRLCIEKCLNILGN